jgi:hypothetical protein
MFLTTENVIIDKLDEENNMNLFGVVKIVIIKSG